MVLSNRPRSIGPIYKGQPFGYAGGTRPGIIFFNDEGTENGGLTFSGRTGADARYQATSHFSFDQFNQDQVLYFQYNDNNGSRRMGFTVADRADVTSWTWSSGGTPSWRRTRTRRPGMERCRHGRASGRPGARCSPRVYVGARSSTVGGGGLSIPRPDPAPDNGGFHGDAQPGFWMRTGGDEEDSGPDDGRDGRLTSPPGDGDSRKRIGQ
jgi:hypothetical protein